MSVIYKALAALIMNVVLLVLCRKEIRVIIGPKHPLSVYQM